LLELETIRQTTRNSILVKLAYCPSLRPARKPRLIMMENLFFSRSFMTLCLYPIIRGTTGNSEADRTLLQHCQCKMDCVALKVIKTPFPSRVGQLKYPKKWLKICRKTANLERRHCKRSQSLMAPQCHQAPRRDVPRGTGIVCCRIEQKSHADHLHPCLPLFLQPLLFQKVLLLSFRAHSLKPSLPPPQNQVSVKGNSGRTQLCRT
jgi:hypothetical protein